MNLLWINVYLIYDQNIQRKRKNKGKKLIFYWAKIWIFLCFESNCFYKYTLNWLYDFLCSCFLYNIYMICKLMDIVCSLSAGGYSLTITIWKKKNWFMLTIITKIYKSIYIFFNFFFFFFWFRNNSSQNVSFNLYSRLIFEYYLHFLDGERYFHVYLQWKMGKNSEIRNFGKKSEKFSKFGLSEKIRTIAIPGRFWIYSNDIIKSKIKNKFILAKNLSFVIWRKLFSSKTQFLRWKIKNSTSQKLTRNSNRFLENNEEWIGE